MRQPTNSSVRQEAEKQRYRLNELPPGVFVYSLKPEMSASEPMHYICQTCYQHGKESILHADENHNGVHHLFCNECKVKLLTGYFGTPKLNYGPGYED